jgi:dihydrofolate synthase/folylpolyglutamate synthase
MLADKDVGKVVEPLADSIDVWVLAGLEGSRAMPAQTLEKKLMAAISPNEWHVKETVSEAYHFAKSLLGKDDRLIIFGSFHTVEAVFLAEPSLVLQ